jgi:NAD(P)-dependent dehydrogenase (short-subunit alcohol dehydrogenase family)
MSGAVLKGKVAIVTGASRGIGRGIAHAFAAEGAKVVVVSRTREGVDRVAAEIREAGGTATGIVCDVADAAAIRATVDKTVAAFGGIDILVNNAQGFGSAAAPAASTVLTPLENLPEADWDFSFATGVTASLRFMQAAFPHLKKGGAGRVINFGSCWGQTGFEGAAAYNANKEAIRGLSRTAAREWGRHGITVNIINPVISTDAFANYVRDVPEAADAMLKQIPVARYGDPEQDAGRIAVFIAGPDSGFLTGMTFQVDGGYYMHP